MPCLAKLLLATAAAVAVASNDERTGRNSAGGSKTELREVSIRPLGDDKDILKVASRDRRLRQLIEQQPAGPLAAADSKVTVEQVLKDIPRPWTVPKLLEHYRRETERARRAANVGFTDRGTPGGPAVVALASQRRAALLWLLALSRDPRGAVAVGEALTDESLFLTPVYCIVDVYLPFVIGGTEQHIDAAYGWWERNRAKLRAQVKELEQRTQRDPPGAR